MGLEAAEPRINKARASRFGEAEGRIVEATRTCAVSYEEEGTLSLDRPRQGPNKADRPANARPWALPFQD